MMRDRNWIIDRLNSETKRVIEDFCVDVYQQVLLLRGLIEDYSEDGNTTLEEILDQTDLILEKVG